MNRPRAVFTAYIASVIAVGAAAIAASLYQLTSAPRVLEWTLFAVAGVLTSACAVKVPGITVRISASDTFFLAFAMLFGPAPAMVATAIDSGVMSWRRGWARTRVLFNTCSTSFALWAAAQVFFLLAGREPLVNGDIALAGLVLPLAAMTVAWFGLNSGLTATAVALESNRPLFEVWKRIAVLFVNYAAAASAAFCLVAITRYASLAAAAAVLPLVFTFQLTIRSWLGRLDDAQQHVAKVNRLYLSTVETLATAIEAKDGVTHDHIRRVQLYAVGLARALGVEDESIIKAIEAAALLHDTGKLAVPEHILNKPGKLTASEFDQMKLHVDVGADILSSIDFPYPVVPIVRCHHENWDGSGYPRGIKGTDIPIGARILSVVDCFDALTSDRPYRRALTDEAAIAILMERRGTMYDPLVVDAFVRMLPQMARPAADPVPHTDALAQISRAAAPQQPPPAVTDVRADGDEIQALASLTRVVTAESSFRDVLAISGEHVRRVLPSGTCVIYLLDDRGEALVAEHAIGPLAPVLAGAVIPISQRLTGWVAANRRTIVNSDAALDLAGVAPEARRTALSTPLVDGETLVGVLTFYADAPETFTDQHGGLAQAAAPHLARMLAVCRSAKVPAQPRVLTMPPSADVRRVRAAS